MSDDFENRMRAMARHGSYEAFLRLDDGQRRSFIESLPTPAEPGLLREALERIASGHPDWKLLIGKETGERVGWWATLSEPYDKAMRGYTIVSTSDTGILHDTMVDALRDLASRSARYPGIREAALRAAPEPPREAIRVCFDGMHVEGCSHAFWPLVSPGAAPEPPREDETTVTTGTPTWRDEVVR